MKSKPVLEVHSLVKKFGDFTAVSDLTFSVDEGQVLGFLGPNGAGKSTTINCLLGVVERDSGEIKMFGKDLTGHRVEVMGKVNYCSAEYILPYSLTLYENLLVYAHYYEVKNAKERVLEVLEDLEMADLKGTRIRSLSLVQRARANFCKALINKPKLLLLDEPMASMDPDVVDKGIKLIKRIQKEEKMTILYTSHNMWEIEQVADDVVFVNHGKIIAQGTPLELTRQELKLEASEPNLREVFIELSRRQMDEENRDPSTSSGEN